MAPSAPLKISHLELRVGSCTSSSAQRWSLALFLTLILTVTLLIVLVLVDVSWQATITGAHQLHLLEQLVNRPATRAPHYRLWAK